MWEIWEKRWQVHNFSALAIYLKTNETAQSLFEEISQQFIGHIVLGHGDYEGNPKYGFSEFAILIHPKSWNELFGTEAVIAIYQYALARLYKLGGSINAIF